MALTITVTKSGVREKYPKLFIVSFTLVVTNDDGLGFTQTFTAQYRPGGDIPAIAGSVVADMQDAIDQYKRTQGIYAHAQIDTVVTAIEAGLEV